MATRRTFDLTRCPIGPNGELDLASLHHAVSMKPVKRLLLGYRERCELDEELKAIRGVKPRPFFRRRVR